MKKLILPLVALISYSASAQFSIQPQIGLESSTTKIKIEDLSSFSPTKMQFAPRISVRMAYQLKTGHGAFIGVATSSPAVDFQFSDPQAASTSYTASAKDLQLRFEGGYQFSTKPIALRKPVYTQVASRRLKYSYGGGMQSRCGQSRYGQRVAEEYVTYKTVEKIKGLYMRVKPSVGLAFASSENEIQTQTKGGQTSYEYQVGWNTAVIAGTAFEFGTAKQTQFVVSVNYLRSLGNNQQTLTTGSVAKPVTTTFSSRTSGFNISVGIPINKTPMLTQKRSCSRSSFKGHCGRYKI